MHKLFAASVVVALGVLACSSRVRGELVINGGFETNAAWVQTPGGIFPNYGYSLAQAHTGLRSIFFANALARDDMFSQTLATTSGTSYTLSFWVFNPSSGSDHLRVTWEGVQVFDQLPLTVPLNQWVQFSYNVTATMNGSSLRIMGYDVPDRLYVDDVSVVAVPAPGSLALLGLSGVLATRRRRVARR